MTPSRFHSRSDSKELLDADEIPTPDLHRNLYELDVINRFLGGHAVTLRGLDRLKLDRTKKYRVLDIGSGGGDTLKAIAKWGRQRGLALSLTGVDLKQDCIDYAANFCSNYPEIGFVRSDYRNLDDREDQYDIIISSLFCHHLSNTQLESLFAWGTKRSSVAFLMNDLHRHPFAYHSISWLTRFFSSSYLVKNDARLSVLRGFKEKELHDMLRSANVNSYELSWEWAFRWLLLVRKGDHAAV